MDFRRYVSKEIILKYLYNNLLGRIIGFIVGMWSTNLISNFFETRSFRNLWGLTSKKTLISKAAYENLEWLVSVVIGFIVFEIVQKLLEDKIKDHYPVYNKKVRNYIEKYGYLEKYNQLKIKVNTGIKRKF